MHYFNYRSLEFGVNGTLQTCVKILFNIFFVSKNHYPNDKGSAMEYTSSVIKIV
jgi:hypothetical protein